MSYARWGEGDVYVYDGGVLICMECTLRKAGANGWRGDYKTPMRSEMLAHLEAHRTAGHTVPERAFNRLRAGIADGLDAVKPDDLDDWLDSL